MNSPVESNKTRPNIFFIVAVALLVLTIVVIGLISAGLFDPKPLGDLSSRTELDRQIEVAGEYLEPLFSDLDFEEYSVRLSSASKSGSLDIGYGLRIGDSYIYVIVAVSPLGYATLMDQQSADGEFASRGAGSKQSEQLLPWQSWPHIKGGRESNEIWIDIKDSNLVSVRVNRELLWMGSIPLAAAEIDFWARSYGKEGVVVIDTIELFGEK